jgi:hypothetical protein
MWKGRPIASAIATNLPIVFSNASTGNIGKLFLDQSDHFGIALVKLQSYVQPHLFV